MLEIKYIDRSKEVPTGRIRFEIKDYTRNIIDPSDLPYKFIVRSKKKIYWETEALPGFYHMYDMWDPSAYAEVYNAKGDLVLEYKPDLLKVEDVCYQFLDYWSRKNPGAIGISIGTHDGDHGEWTDPVRDGRLKGFLIEPSEPQYTDLYSEYSGIPGITCLKEVVSPEGGECYFFEGGEGYMNTIDQEFAKERISSESNFNGRIVNSIGINDLIEEVGLSDSLSWLHIDTEAIDDKLVRALDFNRIKKPQVIIFETYNFDIDENRGKNPGRKDSIFTWLRENGYFVVDGHFNSIAILDGWHTQETARIGSSDSGSFEKISIREACKVDEIYCINLDRRPDRWRESLLEFEKNSIDNVVRYQAFDGRSIKRDYQDRFKGEIAGTISHLNVIREAKYKGLSGVMVFEDDVEFSPEFRSKIGDIIDNYVPHDYDLLLLGGNNGAGIEQINEFVGRIHNSYALQSYIMKDSIYDMAIENWEMWINKFGMSKTKDIHSMAADFVLAQIQPHIKAYCINPGLCYQRPSYSDLMGYVTDYDFLRKKW